ncbi:MAG: hypothetical protein IKT06_01315 [Aeriscardovia sp.]|nr:hypothetical protein [Aeriscardovia sp.]
MQDRGPQEEDSSNLETTENSVYTDDYQTEDAFSQIPASNEFVEEETQELSSVPSGAGGAGNRKGAAEAFPKIEKLQTFREKPKRQRHKKERVAKDKPKKSCKVLKGGFLLSVAAPLSKLASIVKHSSKEATFVALGTAILSAFLIILGFISLHV